jgi:16S rRNA A1518/A1519 N6-dimethyltransferase RsmA/KsgA/DIM1 with predicted DNA glycosylase/AP lyase activity
VDSAVAQGVEGRSVLEGGGGLGTITIELLEAGASEAVVVELSTGYDEPAAELAREHGLEARIARRHGDFAADDLDAADVVVLHRVVCCYPDYARLLRAAAARARDTLVFTYPPRNVLSRLAFATMNLWLRLRGNAFRVFAHDPAAMEAVVRAAGLEPVSRRRGGIWRGVVFARTGHA